MQHETMYSTVNDWPIAVVNSVIDIHNRNLSLPFPWQFVNDVMNSIIRL